MTRKECLEQAMGCVLRDRASQYGGPEDNFGRIAKLWSTYTGTVLDGIDVAMMMALLKVARIRNNKDYSDGYIDLAGYAACGAELAGAEKAREDATRKWGEEYKKLREKAEGGCCQKGKDHSPEVPEFTHGDAVEWNSVARGWLPAVYLREFGDFGHCVVQMDGRERIVSKVDLRRPVPNHPENPDSSPEFKRGDKVEVQMAPDSSTWASATIMAVYRDKDTCEWRYCVDFEDGWAHVTVPSARVRPVSAHKAEGCEELVEKDAPQTPQELYNRIIANNPATYGTPHKPTGEELAEMAEMAEEEGNACS